MTRKVSLSLVGALVAPAVLVAFVLGMVVSAALSCGSRPVQAQVTSTPALGSADAGVSPFVRVADAVIPTVVYISAEKKVKVSTQPQMEWEGPFGEFFKRFFPEMPGMPFEQEQNALGSGVIIDSRGYIVTNNHVIAGFDRIAVKLSDGTEFSSKHVKVVGRDPKSDLAVLKVDADKPLPTLPFGRAEDIKVGDWAIAVGNAFGLQSTVTVGVISAKGRSGIPLPEGPSYQDFIQTDASINPGNSGGALVNIRGELIGINTAIRSPVGANVGIGFAVPVDMVKSVTDQLLEHGKVVRGFLGIRPQPVTEAIRKAKRLPNTNGVLVSEVIKDNPAEKAGVKAGDVITKVNGVDVENVEWFRRKVAELAPGSVVTLTLVRDGKTMTVRVKLTEMPDDAQASVPGEDKPAAKLGIAVRQLTDAERREAGVEGGVVVESVEPGSAAADAGMQRGDIIFEVGDRKIETVADFNRAVTQAGKEAAVLFRVKRGNVKLYVAVEPGE